MGAGRRAGAGMRAALCFSSAAAFEDSDTLRSMSSPVHAEETIAVDDIVASTFRYVSSSKISISNPNEKVFLIQQGLFLNHPPCCAVDWALVLIVEC